MCRRCDCSICYLSLSFSPSKSFRLVNCGHISLASRDVTEHSAVMRPLFSEGRHPNPNLPRGRNSDSGRERLLAFSSWLRHRFGFYSFVLGHWWTFRDDGWRRRELFARAAGDARGQQRVAHPGRPLPRHGLRRGAGRQFNRTHFGLSFGLINGLRFNFDSVT